jgi:hypothetical protein
MRNLNLILKYNQKGMFDFIILQSENKSKKFSFQNLINHRNID